MIDYQAYITSPEWKKRRKKILASFRREPWCQCCLRMVGRQLHHKHYRTLGKESRDDVIPLCRDCHERVHEKAGRPLKPWKLEVALEELREYYRTHPVAYRLIRGEAPGSVRPRAGALPRPA